MKKFTGWLAIILCSLFLMIILLFIVIILISILANPEDKINQMSTKEIISSIFGLVLFTIILIIGLRYGLKKIKEKKFQVIDYTDTLDINLNGKISYKDYRNLLLELTFKKPKWIIYTCLTIMFLLSYLNKSSNIDIDVKPILFGLFFILILPILIIINIKKLYQTNKILHEQLNYKLTNDSIHITGEISNSIQKWTSFYKFKETKKFFMFFQGKGIAVLLDKRMFTDNELIDFQKFTCSLDLQRD